MLATIPMVPARGGPHFPPPRCSLPRENDIEGGNSISLGQHHVMPGTLHHQGHQQQQGESPVVGRKTEAAQGGTPENREASGCDGAGREGDEEDDGDESETGSRADGKPATESLQADGEEEDEGGGGWPHKYLQRRGSVPEAPVTCRLPLPSFRDLRAARLAMFGRSPSAGEPRGRHEPSAGCRTGSSSQEMSRATRKKQGFSREQGQVPGKGQGQETEHGKEKAHGHQRKAVTAAHHFAGSKVVAECRVSVSPDNMAKATEVGGKSRRTVPGSSSSRSTSQDSPAGRARVRRMSWSASERDPSAPTGPGMVAGPAQAKGSSSGRSPQGKLNSSGPPGAASRALSRSQSSRQPGPERDVAVTGESQEGSSTAVSPDWRQRPRSSPAEVSIPEPRVETAQGRGGGNAGISASAVPAARSLRGHSAEHASARTRCDAEGSLTGPGPWASAKAGVKLSQSTDGAPAAGPGLSSRPPLSRTPLESELRRKQRHGAQETKGTRVATEPSSGACVPGDRPLAHNGVLPRPAIGGGAVRCTQASDSDTTSQRGVDRAVSSDCAPAAGISRGGKESQDSGAGATEGSSKGTPLRSLLLLPEQLDLEFELMSSASSGSSGSGFSYPAGAKSLGSRSHLTPSRPEFFPDLTDTEGLVDEHRVDPPSILSASESELVHFVRMPALRKGDRGTHAGHSGSMLTSTPAAAHSACELPAASSRTPLSPAQSSGTCPRQHRLSSGLEALVTEVPDSMHRNKALPSGRKCGALQEDLLWEQHRVMVENLTHAIKVEDGAAQGTAPQVQGLCPEEVPAAEQLRSRRGADTPSLSTWVCRGSEEAMQGSEGVSNEEERSTGPARCGEAVAAVVTPGSPLAGDPGAATDEALNLHEAGLRQGRECPEASRCPEQHDMYPSTVNERKLKPLALEKEGFEADVENAGEGASSSGSQTEAGPEDWKASVTETFVRKARQRRSDSVPKQALETVEKEAPCVRDVPRSVTQGHKKPDKAEGADRRSSTGGRGTLKTSHLASPVPYEPKCTEKILALEVELEDEAGYLGGKEEGARRKKKGRSGSQKHLVQLEL